jgi:hypothetical protein
MWRMPAGHPKSQRESEFLAKLAVTHVVAIVTNVPEYERKGFAVSLW